MRHMKRKAILSLAAFALGGLSFLVPAASHADVCLPAPVGCQSLPSQAVCVEITGPQGLHIVVGYIPTSPSDCQQVPLG